jgi:Mrp family chromosome partitioning ATPase
VPESSDQSPTLLQLATQIRALGLAGKRVILFAPIGSASRSDQLVNRIADALSILDSASVLLLDLKTVPTTAETMAARSTVPRPKPGRNDAPSPELVEFHRNDRLDTGLHLDVGERRVARVYGNAGESADLPQLIEHARPQVRYVLIDAPDVLQSAATLIAAAYVDAVVPIVQCGSVLQSQIASTRKQFATLDVPIAGFIFVEQFKSSNK